MNPTHPQPAEKTSSGRSGLPAIGPVRLTRIFLFLTLVLLSPPAGASENPAASGSPSLKKTTQQEGVSITLSLELADQSSAQRDQFIEGDNAVFRFEIADAEGGKEISGLYPAAWMGMKRGIGGRPTGIDGRSCEAKAAAYITGDILHQPEIDLNAYRIVVMNADPSLIVVDPLFNLKGSNFLAQVLLPSPGLDWDQTDDQRWIFVSMPDSHSIAAVDTISWKLTHLVDDLPEARRVALQPDEHYLWVTTRDGAAALEAPDLTESTLVETGKGPHDIAFRHDSRYAFVTNAGEGTVSVIDIRTLEPVKTLKTGTRPEKIDYSTSGDSVYVLDTAEATLTTIDTQSLEIGARIEFKPGLSDFAFAPGGRFGFAINSKRNKVHVVDAALQRVIQTGDTQEEPVQVAFSEYMAYILHRGSDSVLSAPLDQVGKDGARLSLAEFTGGNNPPGLTSSPDPPVAPMLVQAAGDAAVVFANPKDKSIQYYQEGMAAPKGGFGNDNHEPRALMVVNRALREKVPGSYETSAILERPGTYDVVFYLDSPTIIHCFEVKVAPNPEIEKTRRYSLAKAEIFVEKEVVPIGKPVISKIRLTRPEEKETLVGGVKDLLVMVHCAGSNWKMRDYAKAAKDGTYEFEFEPPDAGHYGIAVMSESLNLPFGATKQLWLEAKEETP